MILFITTVVFKLFIKENIYKNVYRDDIFVIFKALMTRLLNLNMMNHFL